MGLLHQSDWHASWIGFDVEHRPTPSQANRDHPQKEWVQDRPAPLFRREFRAREGVASAVATVCGLGFCELRLNGKKVGDHELDPPFTRYDKRCLYATYDVTRQIKGGENALGVMLGHGWFDVLENEEWSFLQAPWRESPRFLLNLKITYRDGKTEDIVSDTSWAATYGPVIRDAIRNGEVYDAREEKTGWDLPDYDASKWAKAELVAAPKGTLSALAMPAVKVIQTLPAKQIAQPKPGVFVFDFGQNMAGRGLLSVRATAGTEIKIRYGERLAADGTLDQSKIAVFVYAGPFQEERYVAKGVGREEWHSRFTYHGFRYAQVEGYPGTPDAKSLQAQVLHTAFEEPGSFSCSNPLIDDIVRLTEWSYRSNYLGYPTDCPQREKNGWTGDAQLASEMAQYCFQNSAAYEKWMNDFKDEQPPAGDFPGIVPNPGWGYGIGPAWDSAYVVIPWNLYVYQGDRRVLAEHYEGMKRYVDFLTGRAKNGIVDYGLSDWCPAKTDTPCTVTSTAYYCFDALTVSRIAALLGLKGDAAKYAELARSIRKAFQAEHMKPDGTVAEGSQTAQACALAMGLAEPSAVQAIVGKLAADIRSKSDHLDFGILGSKWAFRALSDNGEHELAYRMATQTTTPSYGDMVRRGATTLWEDWYGNESLNHVMFGDVVAWFYEYLAGIQADPERPGFEHFTVRPRPAGDLNWVKARIVSPRGPISVLWKRDGEVFSLSVEVPPNTTATVWVLARDASSVTEGGKPAASAAGVRFAGMRGGAAVFEVRSGRYAFVVGRG
jgi:alpha-L-rhamnosidase